MKSCSTQTPCSLQDREQLPQFGKASNAEQIEMMACQWQIYSDSKAGWQGSPSLREVTGLQRNHKLTGSLNVTLSFPPSCLGRGLKMLLIWYLRLEETGTRALHGSCFGLHALPMTALSLLLVFTFPCRLEGASCASSQGLASVSRVCTSPPHQVD